MWPLYLGVLQSDGHCAYITDDKIQVKFGLSGFDYVAQLVLLFR